MTLIASTENLCGDSSHGIYAKKSNKFQPILLSKSLSKSSGDLLSIQEYDEPSLLPSSPETWCSTSASGAHGKKSYKPRPKLFSKNLSKSTTDISSIQEDDENLLRDMALLKSGHNTSHSKVYTRNIRISQSKFRYDPSKSLTDLRTFNEYTQSMVLNSRRLASSEPNLSITYTKEREIGKGTYATVYLGRSNQTDCKVAIKEIKMSLTEGVPGTAIREISYLKMLDHENIIKLLDVEHTRSNIILVFEYLDCDLRKFARKTALSSNVDLVKTFTKQMFRALAYIHERKVIHRDLKPDNLLISVQKTLKIADFGLARLMAVKNEKLATEVVTLWYRPPEILRGKRDYNIEIDIWSAGCIIFEMVNGSALLQGDNNEDQLRLINKMFESESTYSEAHKSGNQEEVNCRQTVGQDSLFTKKFNAVPALERKLGEKSKEIWSRHHAIFSLMSDCLQPSWRLRISAKSALEEKYYCKNPPSSQLEEVRSSPPLPPKAIQVRNASKQLIPSTKSTGSVSPSPPKKRPVPPIPYNKLCAPPIPPKLSSGYAEANLLIPNELHYSNMEKVVPRPKFQGPPISPRKKAGDVIQPGTESLREQQRLSHSRTCIHLTKDGIKSNKRMLEYRNQQRRCQNLSSTAL